MREVVYKNLTSLGSRKKDIFVQEVFEKEGITAKTERRCLYLIRDVIHLETPGDLQKILAKYGDIGTIRRRRFYVLKQHTDSPDEDKLICKVRGNFYVVVDDNVYNIAFLQSFKVYFSKAISAQ